MNGVVNGYVKGENNGGDDEDFCSNVSNSSMKELEDLLMKLNLLVKEFVLLLLVDVSIMVMLFGVLLKG